METRDPQPADAAHEPVEHEPMEHVVARLHNDFPSVEVGRIREVVELVQDSFREARIRLYIGIFVEREARLRLRDDLIRPPRRPQQPSAPEVPSAIALLGR